MHEWIDVAASLRPARSASTSRGRRCVALSAIVLTGLMAVSGAAAETERIVGRAKVIDGDSLRVDDATVRLFGVDAPEYQQTCADARGQPYGCGRAAKRALAALIDGAVIRCEVRDVDRYKRFVAVCFLGRVDLNAALVAGGWALAYRQYSSDYVASETLARDRQAGLWAGTFEKPWAWRHAQDRREAHAQTPTPSCRIKGNINARGDRIYHVPGQRFYADTTITPAKGERYFCSEADARAAGWRPSAQ